MSYQRLVETVLQPQGRSGNNIIYRCPNCEDSSGGGHLYVDYVKNVFNCFKCGFKSRDVRSLVLKLGFDTDLDYDKLTTVSIDRLNESIRGITKKKTITVEYSRSLEILTEYYRLHTTSLSSQAISYLTNRGVSPEKIAKYQIMEGLDRSKETFYIKEQEIVGRDYSGRVMVPSLHKSGDISFYVGRDYTGTKYSRYVNPPSDLAYASEDVWNLNMVDSGSVIICEGVFTAIAAGGEKGNAVATYGKKISHRSNSDSDAYRITSQGEKLLNRKFDNYYVVYDADAIDESMDTCFWLRARGARVYIVIIDSKKYGEKADVDSIGYDEFLKLLKDAPRYEIITRLLFR